MYEVVRRSYTKHAASNNKHKFILDNVIASGVTASAALEAILEAIVCAIAKA